MSSDLEFFLCPRNFVLSKENIHADKSVHAKTVSQGCMFSGDSAADCSTTVVQNLNVEEHKLWRGANPSWKNY
ncbi:protein SHORTAGE IN CHIASMATA 1 [Salvia divinorum]|uniref:Protein SHORTAGE IN CHIASMATA 1 n=1 Tax=Salvia divinorum TaxID=28513 RepID=A0ABD1HHR7_SALDI